jgi:hypothetical protein
MTFGISDIRNMKKVGRPSLKHPRRFGAFIRFSAAEWESLHEALRVEFPVARRRPTLAEWLRDLVVAHATEVLQVQVTRSGVRHLEGGVADWKRWRIAKAVQRAAKLRRRRR